jgi:EamA domain-containing membrane protein RarD
MAVAGLAVEWICAAVLYFGVAMFLGATIVEFGSVSDAIFLWYPSVAIIAGIPLLLWSTRSGRSARLAKFALGSGVLLANVLIAGVFVNEALTNPPITGYQVLVVSVVGIGSLSLVPVVFRTK